LITREPCSSFGGAPEYIAGGWKDCFRVLTFTGTSLSGTHSAGLKIKFIIIWHGCSPRYPGYPVCNTPLFGHKKTRHQKNEGRCHRLAEFIRRPQAEVKSAQLEARLDEDLPPVNTGNYQAELYRSITSLSFSRRSFFAASLRADCSNFR